MLQVARLAPKLLGEAADLVAAFLRDRQNADGGFADRAGTSDLYYTVFGLEGLIALQQDVPADRVRTYLRTFGDGAALDFVHLCALARCWADAGGGLDEPARLHMIQRLESHRCADGGYGTSPGEPCASAYATFLTYGAYQDLNTSIPQPQRLADCVEALADDDGSYRNDPVIAVSTTPTTAAAVTVLRQLGRPCHANAGDWLMARAIAAGGFLAVPDAPMPDLLSTATALHALAGLHVDLAPIAEPCLDFIDSLWTNKGGFYGNWSEDVLDCEYTYYALLALGHLSL